MLMIYENANMKMTSNNDIKSLSSVCSVFYGKGLISWQIRKLVSTTILEIHLGPRERLAEC